MLTLSVAGLPAAGATPIHILDTQYTTAVYAYAVGSVIGTHDVTRAQTSSVPVLDTLYYPPYSNPPYYTHPDNSQVMAQADAGLFQVSGETVAFPFDPGIARSSTYAESRIQFSPLFSESLDINIQVNAQGYVGGRAWTAGSMRLFDVTSGSELWHYGWGDPFWICGSPSGIDYATPIQWESSNATQATLQLMTALDASHTYELVLRTGSSAATDNQEEWIFLSGFQAVPEPSVFALIGLGLVALGISRRRRTPPGAE